MNYKYIKVSDVKSISYFPVISACMYSVSNFCTTAQNHFFSLIDDKID